MSYYMEKCLIVPPRRELSSISCKIKEGTAARHYIAFLSLGPVTLSTARKILKTYKRDRRFSQRTKGEVLTDLERIAGGASTLTAQGDNFVIYDMDYLASQLPEELTPYVNFTYPQEGTHYSERRHWGLVRALDGENMRIRKDRGGRNYRIAKVELLYPSGFHRVEIVDDHDFAEPELTLVVTQGRNKSYDDTLTIEIGEVQRGGTIRTNRYLYSPRHYRTLA